ncbi:MULTISPECIES: carboxylate-amine ligase [Streptomyces]|uniref:carboxylate-amine ligase n=1 Tax=Streptomyces TaxID=1883 RepID=UPI002248E384|nr:glutamate--cysteine ligase [Streptomyces sp. JHD 1]MCX2970197.1 glutamate--cysteine ligase [Streptomyces sp. JHD 1]
MNEDAAPGGHTIGVEEEFLLVDAATARPAPGAAAVLARAGAGEPDADGAGLKGELFLTQVESASPVCTGLAELADRLAAARARLAAASRAEGLRLVPSASPVLTDGSPRLAPGPRLAAIVERYGDVLADYQVCGCHVHVGVPDRDTAVAVVRRLHPWLPTLLALSANSPYHAGRDSGYASWRMVEQSRLPGSGVAPPFADAAEHDAAVRALVDAGALIDARMSFWLARPSGWLPTVEFRVADTAATTDEAVLQAALCRALVRRALGDIAAGRPEPPHDAQLAAAAVWAAARHGLSGPGVDLRTGRPAPATALLDDLLDHLAPALEDTGDAPTVHRLLRSVTRHGTGAARQRRAHADGGPSAVVRYLAGQTEARLE